MDRETISYRFLSNQLGGYHFAAILLQRPFDPGLVLILTSFCIRSTKVRTLFEKGATIAQWICLRLPLCRPSVESQAQHLCFIIYSQICAIFVI